MDTSKVIKQAQYSPHGVELVAPGTFQTQSRDGMHKHAVRRQGDRFFCDCGCQSLCHHVIDVVVDSARRRGWRVVQVWTSEADARRQKRRTVRYRTNGRPFWVTYAGRTDPEPAVAAPRPNPAPRSVIVAFLWDRMAPPEDDELVLVPTRDVQVDEGDGWRSARASLADIVEMPGWSRGRVRMVRGNERPGLHRFEFRMLR